MGKAYKKMIIGVQIYDLTDFEAYRFMMDWDYQCIGCLGFTTLHRLIRLWRESDHESVRSLLLRGHQ
jgi:hypothetical protein